MLMKMMIGLRIAAATTALVLPVVVFSGCQEKQASDAVVPSAAAHGQPKSEEPKSEEPKSEASKGDHPKGDHPKGDDPKNDAPKQDEPVQP